jgi:hypothetical protein
LGETGKECEIFPQHTHTVKKQKSDDQRINT